MHCYVQSRKAKGNSGGKHEKSVLSGKEAQENKFTFKEKIAPWKDSLEHAQDKVDSENIVEFIQVLPKSNPTSSPIVLPNSTKTSTKSNLMGYSISAFFPQKITNQKYRTSRLVYGRAFQTTLMKVSSNTLLGRLITNKNFG